METKKTEFIRRLVYSLSKPAVRIADRFELGLKEMSTLAQIAYYERKRSRGLALRQIADQFDTSTRTVDRLAKTMRSNFFEPEHEHELPRRIEFMIWSQSMSLARLTQLLPGYDPAQIEEAVALLLERKRIEERPGRTSVFMATAAANRLPDDTDAAKIDALNHLLGTVIEAVERRFLESDSRAAARNVSLRVRPEDLQEIEALYEDVIWPKLVELDARATDEDALEVGWVTCWSPLESEEDK